MKAKHRHELKTNELADWIANLPQWARENRLTIIAISAVIVLAGAIYIWKTYNTKAQLNKQIEFTNLLGHLQGSKMQIINATAEGKDFSYTLLQPANDLKSFAQSVNNNQMAALALIKQADALRTELHYRLETIDKQDLTKQINAASASYNEAIEKASLNPSLMAMAKFGLGLCQEEVGDFEKAKQIYQEIVTNPDFEGTVAKASAEQRLVMMDDYKTKVVFKASAKPVPAAAAKPPAQAQPFDINQPIDINQIPAGLGSQPPNDVSVIPDINLELQAPNSVSATVEANLSDQ